mgnify:CR=1 FL=1
MAAIDAIIAREILDSRGNPTVEVEVLLEDDTGTIIPVNVSASIAPGVGEFAGIDAFRRRHPRAYQRGLLLYPGDRIRPLSDNRWAVPLSTLWTVADQEVPLDVASLDAELEAVRKELEKALKDGAPPERIAELTKKLRQALDPEAPAMKRGWEFWAKEAGVGHLLD